MDEAPLRIANSPGSKWAVAVRLPTTDSMFRDYVVIFDGEKARVYSDGVERPDAEVVIGGATTP